MATWTLVTGQPGCGKTTLVKRVLATLRDAAPGLNATGFYTDEVLGTGGKRVGFDVVTIPGGERGVLSRKGGPSNLPRTGKYAVDVEAFEALALPTLEYAGQDVIIIDEIGRMELHSDKFRRAIEELLGTPGVRCVGAITSPIYGHRVPFCDAVTANDRVETLRIKKSNRDDVTQDLLQRLAAEFRRSKEDRRRDTSSPPSRGVRKRGGRTATAADRRKRRTSGQAPAGARSVAKRQAVVRGKRSSS